MPRGHSRTSATSPLRRWRTPVSRPRCYLPGVGPCDVGAGWYVVYNREMARPLPFGRGWGCDFMNSPCIVGLQPINSIFCMGARSGCSIDRQVATACNFGIISPVPPTQFQYVVSCDLFWPSAPPPFGSCHFPPTFGPSLSYFTEPARVSKCGRNGRAHGLLSLHARKCCQEQGLGCVFFNFLKFAFLVKSWWLWRVYPTAGVILAQGFFGGQRSGVWVHEL